MRAWRTPCRIECEMIEWRLSVIDRITTLPGLAALSLPLEGLASALVDEELRRGRREDERELGAEPLRDANGGGRERRAGESARRHADESRGASQASMFNPVRALMGRTSLLGVRDRGSTVKEAAF